MSSRKPPTTFEEWKELPAPDCYPDEPSQRPHPRHDVCYCVERHAWECAFEAGKSAGARGMRDRIDPLWLAQIIRTVDGSHDLGAAALADRIVAAVQSLPLPGEASEEGGDV